MKTGWIYAGNKETQEKFAPFTTVEQVFSSENGLPFETYLAHFVLEHFFPIGTIYVSTQSESPAERLGGVWEVQEKKILAGMGNDSNLRIVTSAETGLDMLPAYLWKRIA